MKSITIALLLVCVRCIGMDRFEALSQIESGDNDKAIGQAGEVSRYQIMPSVWQAETNKITFIGHCQFNATRKSDAWVVVGQIMAVRIVAFESKHHREPTRIEFYLLWACPSRVDFPSAKKLETAKRFANLCEDSP